MNIVLYGRPFNRTDRVQWLLEELHLVYDYRVLAVFELEHRTEAIRSRYPLARLPFIEIDGEVMFESGAIMLYLAESARDEIDLLPKADASVYRAVLQWLFFAVSTLEASEEHLESGAPPGPFAPRIDTLRFVDGALEGRRYIAGDTFSVADIALANGFKWFDRQTLDAHENIIRYCADLMGRPAYRKMVAQPEYPDRGRNLF